ncbi:MAG: hypothetical protein HWD58_17765 [Bacteroidota bacterium]|nr:MAG: hypothetical protein HWD58_17765 [Bacteroidota bacterium]
MNNEFDHAINLESDQIKNLKAHRDSLVFPHNHGKVFLRSISIYHVRQSNTVVGMQGYFYIDFGTMSCSAHQRSTRFSGYSKGFKHDCLVDFSYFS